MSEKQNLDLKVELDAANKEITALHAQLRQSEALRQECEGRLSSMLLEQGVWSSTLGGGAAGGVLQKQLAEAFAASDAARREQFAASRRAESAEAQQEQLMQRILELECLLASAQAPPKQQEADTEQRIELEQLRAELRESAARIADLASQLRVQECEAQIALGRARETARQSSAQAVLHRAEAAECRMIADAYR